MIAMHASLVCTVRDGFTGRALLPGQVRCGLDGMECKPLIKKDGYWIFTNLFPGPHCLTLLGKGYQTERVEFVADGGTERCHITMKPARDYPFGRTVTTLVVEGPALTEDAFVWLAMTEAARVAQSQVEAGTTQMRIFQPDKGVLVTPACYLLGQGDTWEIVDIRRQLGESVECSYPLRHTHLRSAVLRKAERYYADDNGMVQAMFPMPCAVELLCGDTHVHLELAEGENRCTLP